jgi:Tol biopolymer transport system component/DNA-binding winged helix-turn-helix (wHTH) protein
VRDRIVYEFGDVRVDLGLMSAARGTEPIPLEPKAFDVLAYLLAHRDRLVTKDELLDAVWAGTFVTPNVLTRVIAQIRRGLGDESGDARYVETVAKRGYRFIAPVTVVGDSALVTPPGPAPEPPAPAARAADGAPGRHTRAAFAVVAVLAIAAAALAAFFLPRDRGRRATGVDADLHLQRLTNRRGYSANPALAPDGHALVYSSDAKGPLELYLTSLTPGVAEVQLTNDGGQNIQPDWSPDGQWIAFHSRKRGGVWIVPANGGTPQQVTDFGSDPAWSPDNATIAFTSDAGGLAGQSSLWIVNRDGSGRRALTKIGTPAGGHRSPSWSHDGRHVVFVVTRGGWTMQIWTVDVATGEQRLVDTTTNGADPCFAPTDRAVLWGGATQTVNGRLFRRAVDENGAPVGETEAVLPMDAGIVEGVSLASNGTLAFAAKTTDANFWAVDVGADGRGGEPVRLTDDLARSTHPNYGPGRRVAYQQVPIGSSASIWIMNEDGSGRTSLVPGTPGVEPQWDPAGGRLMFLRWISGKPSELAWIDLASRRITASGLPLGDMLSVRLSPDAKAVAFHTIDQDGRMRVWTSRFDGTRTLVAADPEAVSYPAWSPDGRWLAVELKRGDATQVGLVAAAGGPIVQLTTERGQNWPHSWAPDGDRIAFAGQRDGVWNVYTVSRTTRAITQVTFFTSAAGYVRYPAWSPAGSRVVFERSLEGANIWTATLPSERGALDR